MAAELRKDIVIVNNRRTPDRKDDDLSLSTDGPLYYEESRNLIHTDPRAVVYLKDTQSKPEPNTVTAVGMNLELTPPEANKNKPSSSRKNQQESISGVDCITLQSLVQMDLYVDPRSGFMSR